MSKLVAYNEILLRNRNSDAEGEPLLEQAKGVFLEQAEAIARLADKVGKNYLRAVEVLLSAQGHVVICGIGKSGLIGRKMASTFASTGTPSFFVHPADAFHGDLGMIKDKSTIILISYSGETEEIIRLIPYLKRHEVFIIGFVGEMNSTLAEYSNVVLDIAVEREACPNNLAPTNSTLATLAMGDALAVSLMNVRGFKSRDFARLHPGGRLGRRLNTRVRDAMRINDLPVCFPTETVHDSLMTITQGRLGLVLVMEDEQIRGIVTDGDLRRALLKYRDLGHVTVGDIMSAEPIFIYENAMISEAEEIMREKKIKALVVLNTQNKVSGILEIFND